MTDVSRFPSQFTGAIRTYTQGNPQPVSSEVSKNAKKTTVDIFPRPIFRAQGAEAVKEGKRVLNSAFLGFCVLCPPFLAGHALTAVVINAFTNRKTPKSDLKDTQIEIMGGVNATELKPESYLGQDKIHAIKNKIVKLNDPVDVNQLRSLAGALSNLEEKYDRVQAEKNQNIHFGEDIRLCAKLLKDKMPKTGKTKEQKEVSEFLTLLDMSVVIKNSNYMFSEFNKMIENNKENIGFLFDRLGTQQNDTTVIINKDGLPMPKSMPFDKQTHAVNALRTNEEKKGVKDLFAWPDKDFPQVILLFESCADKLINELNGRLDSIPKNDPDHEEMLKKTLDQLDKAMALKAVFKNNSTETSEIRFNVHNPVTKKYEKTYLDVSYGEVSKAVGELTELARHLHP